MGEVGATVYEDPYVAIDDYVAAIVPEWEFVPYALDFLTYNVGDTHSYPRFLYYDCHGFRSYSTWNPYTYPCTSYQVVIWDDPYFYPRYRYVGTRVVFARPLGPRPRYGVTARVVGAGWAPVVKRRAAPPSRVVEYKESPRSRSFQPRNPSPRRSTGSPSRRRSTPAALPNRTRPTTPARSATGVTPRGATRAAPSRATQTAPPRRATGISAGTTGRPTLRHRPSSPSARLPARGTTSTRGATSRGTTIRGTTNRGMTSRRPSTAAPNRGAPPNRAVGAAPRRPPSRAVPRSGTSGRRPPAALRPSAGSRTPRSGRSVARPSTQRPTTRARPTPRRRPGGGA